jgi:hypothetical protein
VSGSCRCSLGLAIASLSVWSSCHLLAGSGRWHPVPALRGFRCVLLLPRLLRNGRCALSHAIHCLRLLLEPFLVGWCRRWPSDQPRRVWIGSTPSLCRCCEWLSLGLACLDLSLVSWCRVLDVSRLPAHAGAVSGLRCSPCGPWHPVQARSARGHPVSAVPFVASHGMVLLLFGLHVVWCQPLSVCSCRPW